MSVLDGAVQRGLNGTHTRDDVIALAQAVDKLTRILDAFEAERLDAARGPRQAVVTSMPDFRRRYVGVWEHGPELVNLPAGSEVGR